MNRWRCRKKPSFAERGLSCMVSLEVNTLDIASFSRPILQSKRNGSPWWVELRFNQTGAKNWAVKVILTLMNGAREYPKHGRAIKWWYSNAVVWLAGLDTGGVTGDPRTIRVGCNRTFVCDAVGWSNYGDGAAFWLWLWCSSIKG